MATSPRTRVSLMVFGFLFTFLGTTALIPSTPAHAAPVPCHTVAGPGPVWARQQGHCGEPTDPRITRCIVGIFGSAGLGIVFSLPAGGAGGLAGAAGGALGCGMQFI